MVKKTLFCRDTWLYEKPLNILYPNLFKLCEQPDISLYSVKMNSLVITFTRWLVDDLREHWNNILRDVSNIILDTSDDVILWKFGNKGSFTVKYVYNALSTNDVGPYHKKI
jgi:hypothetical protein